MGRVFTVFILLPMATALCGYMIGRILRKRGNTHNNGEEQMKMKKEDVICLLESIITLATMQVGENECNENETNEREESSPLQSLNNQYSDFFSWAFGEEFEKNGYPALHKDYAKVLWQSRHPLLKTPRVFLVEENLKSTIFTNYFMMDAYPLYLLEKQ